MTDSEKLELLLVEMKATRTDIGEMKTDIVEMKTDIREMKTDISELKTEIVDIRTDMNRNNNFLLTEMERLHEIALDKIDVVAQEVSRLKANRNTEDFLIHQVADLKCRVEKIEGIIA